LKLLAKISQLGENSTKPLPKKIRINAAIEYTETQKQGIKMNNIEEKATQLLKELNFTKLKDESKRTNILLQQLLQKLMLTYTVDITEQVTLKQADINTTYPSDLISSLKIIADLYFKMKEQNKGLTVKEEKDSYNDKYVF
jgi:hypothetical protein